MPSSATPAASELPTQIASPPSPWQLRQPPRPAALVTSNLLIPAATNVPFRRREFFRDGELTLRGLIVICTVIHDIKSWPETLRWQARHLPPPTHWHNHVARYNEPATQSPTKASLQRLP
jgi:hypothetical protein